MTGCNPFVSCTLLLAAFLGHGFVWTAFVNRLHGMSLRRPICYALSWFALACVIAIPVGVALGILLVWQEPGDRTGLSAMPGLVRGYLLLTAAAGVLLLVSWAIRAARPSASRAYRASRSHTLDLRPTTGPGPFCGGFYRQLLVTPGNQILQLSVVQCEIDLPRMSPRLDGLAVVQLTDLHLTGRVGKEYFEEVVRTTLELKPDLIAITGDLVDDVRCVDWLPDTLGKLDAPHGVYFILGNHDLGGKSDRIRRTLVASGLVDLGGRWVEVGIRGERVVLAGNELPWFSPKAELSAMPQSTGKLDPLRILLSHSPDQYRWARENQFDLMLAGHTHGGQFRVPGIGPLLTPSRFGVRYASGTFRATPTVLHVSRGLSAKLPLRINCRPELPRLTLHAASSAASS